MNQNRKDFRHTVAESVANPIRIAIQGERGSNSHMAAVAVGQSLGQAFAIVPCEVSAEVFAQLGDGRVETAVLPIENSLHGSVAEHYDLLLRHPVSIVGETLLRVRHHVIVAPEVRLEDVRRILSHPVALSQCRLWLAAHREIEPVPFYDTAGSVKHLVRNDLRDAAAIAPELAATEYGAEILVSSVEDHPENYTRFYQLATAGRDSAQYTDKASLAFSVEHRPGTLIAALEEFRRAGLNLTRIESRPVPGSPWEYVFFVEVRFETKSQIDSAVAQLSGHCRMVRELGRYRAA